MLDSYSLMDAKNLLELGYYVLSYLSKRYLHFQKTRLIYLKSSLVK